MEKVELELALEVTSEGETSGWIFTFADMMTLILTFFVLMFSMSKIEVDKFKAIMASVQASFGEYSPAIENLQVVQNEDQQKVEASSEADHVQQALAEEMENKRMLKDIQDFITEKGINKNIVASVENGKIVLRVKDKALFSSGAADLNANAEPILEDIIAIINRYINFRVSIAGHTDNVPIHTERFPSNWELSAIRATTVLRYLIGEGVQTDRVTATGYGELLPLSPNDTPENRAHNRRVEFVLEKEK